MDRSYNGSDLSDRDSSSNMGIEEKDGNKKGDNESTDSLELEEDKEETRYFILNLKPNKIYTFKLTFDPKNTLNYRFDLPLYYANSDVKNKDIQRKVTCRVVPPKIMLTPMDGRVNFGKVVIPHLEETIPKKMVLLINNPDN